MNSIETLHRRRSCLLDPTTNSGASNGPSKNSCQNSCVPTAIRYVVIHEGQVVGSGIDHIEVARTAYGDRLRTHSCDPGNG